MLNAGLEASYAAEAARYSALVGSGAPQRRSAPTGNPEQISPAEWRQKFGHRVVKLSTMIEKEAAE